MEFLNILNFYFTETGKYRLFEINVSNIILAVIVFLLFFYSRSLFSKIIFKKISFLLKFKNKKQRETFYQNVKMSLDLFSVTIGFFFFIYFYCRLREN